MTLALFDLDNTLLNGDSDYEWGSFLVRKGFVDKEAYDRTNRYFLAQYEQGNLDIHAFAEFAYKPLSENSLETLNTLHKEFMHTVIEPLMTQAAHDLVQKHKNLGHTCLVITATNSFITRPIAQAFGVEHLLATEAAMEKGRYLARIEGTPCFQQGKVTRLLAWLNAHQETLKESFFYSDSHNDLPLLECVTYPVAVNPDPTLKETATQREWPILALH